MRWEVWRLPEQEYRHYRVADSDSGAPIAMKLMYDVHDAIEIVFSDLITIRENLFFKSTHVSMVRPYVFASQDSLGDPYPLSYEFRP